MIEQNKLQSFGISKRGFTLIELLIVIGILAILATATILVLNPAQLFAQARDAQRVADLDTLKSAIGLYLASISASALDTDTAPAFTCGTNYGNSSSAAGNNTTRMAALTDSGARKGLRAVDSTGWLPVKFSDIPGGAPFAALPVDPQNAAVGGVEYNYQYSCKAAKTFELNAVLESTKYKTTDDLDGKDGGNNAAAYEVGTDLTS